MLDSAMRLEAQAIRLALAALVVAALAPAVPARATDITVSTTDDELNVDGDCSLREAIRAAGINQAVDACPAGESNARDVITLASGALYALTIPGADNLGAVGDLDVVNNAATDDLLIQVAGGGTATIEQDAVPGDAVFEVMGGASVEIDDVEIRGGSGSTGGGFDMDPASSLTLRRCLLTGNHSDNGGGAIANAGTSLVLDSCVVTGNDASIGGGVFTAIGSSTVIDKTLFADNVANDINGGAISTNGKLTVTRSSFVDNRAALFGGAIANIASTSHTLSVTGSCFIGNEGAIKNPAQFAQRATGNWWGSPDGPAATGQNTGDTVDQGINFNGFLVAPPADCLPQEMLANGGFESHHGVATLPDRWRLRRLQGGSDGLVCGGDGCALGVAGSGQRKQILQTIDVAGDPGDVFTFRAGSSAAGVPASGGRYLAQVLLVHADGTRQARTVKFSAGDHGLEIHSKSLIAKAPYVRLKVLIEYGRASGTVAFDDVSVVREP